MKFGIRLQSYTWMIVLCIDPEHFYWKPGEIESGSSSPAERFDAVSDKYWMYGWLGFTVFFAKAGY